MVSDLYPDLSSPTMSPWRSPFFQGSLPSPMAKEGIPTGVPFVPGDEHADRRAHAMGVDPQANMDWLRLAKTQIGAPYVWDTAGQVISSGGGGLEQGYGNPAQTTREFDCSGFAQWLVKRITGQTLSHHAATQATETQKVDKAHLRPGDLLFFSYGGGIGHVEIYMGNGRSIGAQGDPGGLDEKPVDWTHFVQGGRVPGMSSGGVVQAQKGAMMRAKPMPDTEPAEMTRGSVLLYVGSMYHGGGANTTDTDRVGVNITYSVGWLRQEENQYLACPPEFARDLPEDVARLAPGILVYVSCEPATLARDLADFARYGRTRSDYHRVLCQMIAMTEFQHSDGEGVPIRSELR
jgi:cell wall-associated NlpC family hydrolase